MSQRRYRMLSRFDSFLLRKDSSHQATVDTSRNLRRFGAIAIATLSLLSACGGGDDGGASPVEQDAAARSRAAAFVGYTRPDTYGRTLLQADILVPVRDGFQLTCNLTRPANIDGTPAPGKFPSLLTSFTSYGRTNPAAADDVTGFARKGYAVLWCNTRGSQGINKGSPSRPESVTPVNPFAPQEGQDNFDVIEWMAAQPWSTGNVGQIGTSYGGITSLRVAGMAPPHLKAIIPIFAPHDLYRDFFTEHGVRITDIRGIWPALCSTLTGEDTCGTRLPAEWNAHPTDDGYWAARKADLGAIQVPALFLSGNQDFWTGAQDDRWALMGQRDNVSTVIGPWAHSIPEFANPELYGMYLAWFDRWVAGKADAPLPPKALATAILSTGGTPEWDGFAAWPPVSSENRVLYLTSAGLQGGSPGTGTLQFVIAADGTSAGLTLRTEPFAAATTLAGSMQVKLPLSFSATDANINAKVTSQAADGTITDMGYGAVQKASHLESSASPSARVPGQTYLFTMNIPSKYWKFKAGERMVVTISSSDPNYVSDSPPGTVTVSLGADAFVRAPMLSR
jgi:predicted acyl esterase